MMRSYKRVVTAATALAAAFFSYSLISSLLASAPQVPANTWAATDDMTGARAGAAATLLPDGRVLVSGGTSDGGAVTASVERYSVSGGGFLATPSMQTARANHTSTLLLDGRVLVIGGVGVDGHAVASAEIYDPALNAWSSAGPLAQARAGGTASLLADGHVLVAGGDDAGVATSALEIFDPSVGLFSQIDASLSSARTGHAAATLADGRVLIAGGFDGVATLASTDIYDPQAGSIAAGPSLATPRAGHTATTLVNGLVLVAGGASDAGELASAEIFDPAANGFSAAGGSLAAPRQRHLAVLLPHNNNVLIVGGLAHGSPVAIAELYVPWEATGGSFVPVNAPMVARAWAAAGALSFPASATVRSGPSDGLMLLAGGSATTDATSPLKSAELFGFATIKTDKADYSPGETVTMTGSGWQPGEWVTLMLKESPDLDEHPLLAVQADNNGNIVSTEFSPDVHDINIKFALTAIGAVSQAQTTFTDGNGTITGTVKSTAAGNPAISGASVTCTTACNGGPVSTNGAGSYSIPVNFSGNSATVTITASATGFNSAALAVNVSNGATTANQNFLLAPISAANSTVSASPASVADDGVAASTITVTVKDTTGAAVSGKTVTLAQGGGHSTISPASATTNSSGVATFTVKDTTAETVTYTATVDTVVITQTASVTFTVGPVSAATSTVVASPTSVTADGTSTSTITVTLKDGTGNPVGGKAVSLTAGAGSSTISTVNGTTNASGQATFTVKDTVAEAVTYTGKDTTDNITVTQTATVTFTAGTPTAGNSTVAASPTSVTANGVATSTITVTLKDANNNPVSGKAVSLTAGSGSSTITVVSGTTNASGQATFTVKDTVAEAVTYTGKDTTDNVTVTQTATVTFVAGTPTASNSTVAASPTSVTADGTTTSTITVTLRDSTNNPVSGKSVSLTAGSGNSTIIVVSSTTNAAGQATFTVKDAVAEAVTYTGKDLTDNVTVTQTATVTFTAGTPTAGNSTVLASPTSVVADGSSSSTITVTLKDANNNPVNGKIVSLTAAGGSSVITTVNATTNASGQATFTVKDTVAEAVTYTGKDTTDNVTVTQTATVTFTAGTPNATHSTATASPGSVAADGVATSTITVTLKDVNNNLVSGKTVTLSQGAGSSTISAASGPSDASGVVTFTVKSTKAETVTYTATDTTDAVTITQTAAVTFTAGAAAKLAFGTQPSNTVAGQSIAPAITAQVQDQFGNPVNSSTASITIAIGTNPASGTLSGTTTVAANGTTGTASFNNLSIDKAGDGYTLTASNGGLTGATSTAFNITAGVLHHFLINPISSPQTAGTAFNITVTAQDVNNNTVTSFDGNGNKVNLTSTGTLIGAPLTTPAFTNGVLSNQSVTITNTGTFTISATGTGNNQNITGTSNAFTVHAATANKLAFGVQPTSTQAGSAITPAVTVKVEDQFGNVVDTDTSNVSIAISAGGVLSGTSTTILAAVGGVATFSNLMPTKAGTGFTLSATDGALTGATSTSFDVTAGTATQLAFGVQPTTATAGQTITPAVTVRILDAFNNLTNSGASVAVAISPNPTSAVLGGTLAQNAVNGVATFGNLTVDKGGVYTLGATSAGLTSATSSPFTINNPAPTLTSIAPTSGNLTQSFDVVFTGSNFINGVSSVSFGPDITVNTTTVDSATQITANITIASTAATGLRNASVTNAAPGGGTATLTNAFTVLNPATTTVVTSSLNPSTFGDPVTFTATVTSSAGTPTGSVTFYDGGTCPTPGTALSGAIALNGAGIAMTAVSTLTAGSHGVLGCYTPTGIFTASGGSVSQTVNQATTMTSVSPDVNPAATGQNVTFTAMVVPTVATGMVKFYDGATQIGTTQVLSGGAASVSTSSLAAGNHSITAVYLGDLNFVGSTSVVLQEKIDTPPVSAADAFAVVAGTTLQVSAPGVLANDNDSDSGQTSSAVLVAGPANAAPSGFILNADGSFSYTPASGFTGLDSFTYKANDTLLDGNTVTVTVSVLAATASPVSENDAYHTTTDTPLAADTTSGVLANDHAAHGIKAVVASGPAHADSFVLNDDGSFSYTPASGFTGADSFVYVAHDGTSDSDGNPALVIIAVLAPAASPVANNDHYSTDQDQPLTVSPAAGVLANDADATAAALVVNPLYGSVALNADGSFTYTPASGFSGVDSFIYRASSDAGSSNLALVTIRVRTATVITVTADHEPSTFGQAVTFTATFAPSSATGSVQFKIDGVDFGGPAPISGGAATSGSTSDLPAGPHAVSAVYNGDDNYTAATGSLSHVVNRATPVVAVSFATSPIVYDGDPHGASATVTGVSGALTIPTDGTVAITYTQNAFPFAGTPTDAATYTASAHFTSANPNYTDADSAADALLVINKADPTVTAVGNTCTYNGSPCSGTGTAKGVKNEPLAPVNLAYTVVAAPPRTPGDLMPSAPINAGTYSVAARYAGDANYNPKQSAPATITINKAAPTVMATGGTFTYNGTPRAGSGSATGGAGEPLTVTLSYSGTGSTVYGPTPTAPTNAGTYQVVAHTNGDSNNNAGDSAPAALVINKATPTVTANGGTFTYTATPHPGSGSATGGASEPLTVTLSYSGTGSTVYGPTPTAPTNAGTYQVVAHTDGDSNNNAGDSAPAALVINKADPIVTAAGNTCTYNGSACAGSGSAKGVVNEMLAPVSLAYTVVAAPPRTPGDLMPSAPIDAGTYSVAARYAGDANYNPIQSAPAAITINKATPIITWTNPADIIYGTALGPTQLNASASVPGAFVYTPVSGTVLNPGSGQILQVTFTPADTANYNSAAKNVAINVTYGACSASVGAGGVILPPINNDGTSVFNRKGGSTIPVKFRVCDSLGRPISNGALVFADTGGSLTMLSAVRGTVDGVNESTVTDVPDVAFRWDGSTQWIFNMATTNLTQGSTYTFRINLAYGSITFVVAVK